jgi:hypothetical protein
MLRDRCARNDRIDEGDIMPAIIEMLTYGICVIGLLTGVYILYLANYRPRTFRKPVLAKRQGAIAFVIGVLALAVILIFRI